MVLLLSPFTYFDKYFTNLLLIQLYYHLTPSLYYMCQIMHIAQMNGVFSRFLRYARPELNVRQSAICLVKRRRDESSGQTILRIACGLP
jgi:hypothetical protein